MAHEFTKVYEPTVTFDAKTKDSALGREIGDYLDQEIGNYISRLAREASERFGVQIQTDINE